MSSIIIPFLEKDGVTEVAEVFADELPLDDADFNGLIDVLRSELCPLKVWRDCALEYYRQGFKEGFDVMLHEIVESLAHPDVDKHYKKERDDFNEKMADIFNSLAARGLSTLLILKSSSSQVNESEVETLPRKIVEYLRRAEEYVRVNEFTWLLRGFYEISQGELKRAEDTLNAICLRANKDISKRKYSFGAFLGLAVVHFNKQNYNSCLDFLNKSISSNSFCESSCYVALSSCYQMLRQYDKAKLAIDKALDLEPTNVNALATAATLEQALAKTEKSKKKEHLLMANDYCMTALSIDGTNSVALNYYASHLFHTWKSISCVVNFGNIYVNFNDLQDININDPIIFNNNLHKVCFISDITEEGKCSVILLNEEVPSSITEIKVLHIYKGIKLCQDALLSTTLTNVRSESYYLLGKAFQMLGKIDDALEYYKHSISNNPNMTVAQFEAAKILFSRREFRDALDLFNQIKSKHEDDKDTTGFIFLLNSIIDKQLVPYDKLKEVATSFQFEPDLWLIQAILRQGNLSEQLIALKCYHHALDLLEQADTDVHHIIYTNMSSLYHSLGKLPQSLSYCIKSFPRHRNNSIADVIFRSSEFEGVFYEWKDIPIECHKVDELGIIKFVLSNIGTFKLEAYLHIGDDIRLNDVICKVQQIGTNEFFCKGYLINYLPNNENIKIYQKSIIPNFSDSNITICFNLARILEDMGSTKAATELHIELLKCHPSYIECYIRLSNICKGMGKYDEASLWLSRASAVDDSNSDLLTCQGDLYSRSSHWNEAKKSYEKIISKNKHDARSMVSLGNFYLKNFNVDDKQEKNLKDSYKFYYHALNENKRNIFAAVGLGIVCSEKGKYDSAKEIFTRSRELLTSNCTNSEDITTNLGIVFFKQQKYFDAENIFLSSIKIAVKNIYHYDKIESLYNYAALTQFNQKKYKDSVKSLQKLINFNPSNSSFWFNLAISKSNFSTDYLNNVEQVYVSDNLVDAFDEFKFAVKILKFLTVSTFASKNMDKNQIKKFNKDCMGNFIIFSNSIQIAEAKKLELLKGPSLDTNTIQRNHAEAPVDTSIQGEIFNEKLVNNPEIRDAEEDNDINGNNTAVVNTKRNLDSEDSGSFKKVKIDLSSTDC